MVLLQKILITTLAIAQSLKPVNANKIWREGDAVPFSVKALSPGGNSYDGKLYLHPVSYYDQTLGNPKPVDQVESYGSDIYRFDEFFGNHFFNAPFNSTFNDQGARCKLLADRYYKEVNVTLINDLIKKNYKLNFYVDDVPVGRELFDSQTSKFYIDNGVPLGYIDIDKVPHYFNHFQFVIYYVDHGLEYEILYSTVSTQSLTRIPQVPLTCALTPPLLLRYSDFAYNGNRITYDVIWKELNLHSKTTTWDLYKNDVVRPFISFSILFIFTVLTLIIGLYTYYTINTAFTFEKLNVIYKKRSDAAALAKSQHKEAVDEVDTPDQSVNYSDDQSLIEEALEFSWPSLVNDVFRKPALSPLLYYLISQGFHFTVVSLLIIVQLALGYVQLHGHENSLTSAIFTMFLISAPFQSLVNSYLFKTFETSTKSTVSTYYRRLGFAVLLNSLTIPSITFFLIHQTNNAHASVNSPVQIPTHQYDRLSYAYIFVTFISFVGSLRLWKESEFRTSEIEKKISAPPITFRSIPNMIITGLFPFGVVLIPLSTIYLTLWYNHFFVTGPLVYTYVLLVSLLIAISILNVYYSLSIGNWKWQWYSFLSGISIGFYSFAYSFYLTKFKFGDHASFIIFLLQNAVISSILGLIGGFVTFFSSLVFVRKLYSGIQN